MRSWKFLVLFLASSVSFAAQSDRVARSIDPSRTVRLTGNVHGLAQSRFDQGRADGGMLLHGVTLAFRPSAAQQADLENLLVEQQNRLSPNYHKWLTPRQFADRFGMTPNDVARITAWLESQGLIVKFVANSRNQISFDGTVAEIEAVFGTEIHDYLVDEEIHFANATNPSVPAALAASILSVGHLHNFTPKPRSRRIRLEEANPDFTSHISGNHFLAPGDFATIYDVQNLYNGGIDGTGERIVTTGQSSINLQDMVNFRNAAGLSANPPTLLLVPNTGVSARCAGDEGESDLDVEWSGAVAKNANITLVYAGLASGDTCTSRQFGAFDALQYAIDQNIAPVISNSYGNCESAVGLSFAETMQGWIQQANAQGQTVISSSGDSGAADCDFRVTTATHGAAVDIPAAIPEVTGMGGTEFDGDAEATVTNGNADATPFWSGTTGGVDTISSALPNISFPEMAWNDTSNPLNTGGQLLASGGGASSFFPKPSWQTGTGVPIDNKRHVPDLALSASPIHDPYLFCSEDGQNGAIVASCTSGFRDASNNLDAVGGTSAAAPTFAALVALLNQNLGAGGLGNINPNLYSLAASHPSAFHDVTAGNNIVPCSSGTLDCPATAPFQFGFNAGTGYDLVTGLGSVDANALLTAWNASRSPSSVTISPSATTITAGTSVTFKATVTPPSGVGTVTFSALNNGNMQALGTATLNIPFPPASSGTATFTTTALAAGSNSVTATYAGDAADGVSTSLPAVVTVSDFTLAAGTLLPSSVAAGQSASAILTLTPVNGSTQTINFTNSAPLIPGSCTSGLPAGSLCSFNPASVTLDGIHSKTVTMTITTAPNTALGTQNITVTGTASGAGGASHNAVPSPTLTITATTESFTLSSVGSFSVAAGGTVPVPITVNSTNGFITVSGTTAVPLSYTCTGIPSNAQITCQFSPSAGQSVSATVVTLDLVTTPKTARLQNPFEPGSRVFYALLLPGLLGIAFGGGSGSRRMRMLSLMVVGFCTLWLASCGGSSNSQNNPGTPPGTYVVTVTATTGGANPLTNSASPLTVQLIVN